MPDIIPGRKYRNICPVPGPGPEGGVEPAWTGGQLVCYPYLHDVVCVSQMFLFVIVDVEGANLYRYTVLSLHNSFGPVAKSVSRICFDFGAVHLIAAISLRNYRI